MTDQNELQVLGKYYFGLASLYAVKNGGCGGLFEIIQYRLHKVILSETPTYIPASIGYRTYKEAT